jgi:outer membrane lipoprotein-sorting protein
MIRILLIALLALGSTRAHTLESVLAEMDKSAASFHSLTARVRVVRYTAIVNDETVDEGTIWVKRLRPRVSRLLIEFTVPDRYYVALSDKKAEIYRPKIATVEEYDISRFRNLADQLWLLSFGAAGRDLAARYQASFKGEEKAAGQPAVKIEMVPRSAQLLQHVPRIEMWISTEFWQPVQQKVYEITAGDYRLYTYTEVKWNFAFPDARLQLPTPPGTKRIHPQK